MEKVRDGTMRPRYRCLGASLAETRVIEMINIPGDRRDEAIRDMGRPRATLISSSSVRIPRRCSLLPLSTPFTLAVGSPSVH